MGDGQLSSWHSVLQARYQRANCVPFAGELAVLAVPATGARETAGVRA